MLTTKAGYNIKETTDTSTGTVFSELIIDSVEEINEGAYTCKGSNTMPNDELKQDQSSSELKVISGKDNSMTFCACKHTILIASDLCSKSSNEV